jgi:putative membrane protein
MKDFFIKWFINIVALELVAHSIAGVHLDKWQSVIMASLVLGLLNAFLKPVIVLLTLPFNMLSLGFITLLINGFMFYLASKIVKGFIIIDFWNAFWGALLFSVFSFFISLFFGPKIQFNFRGVSSNQDKSVPDDKIIDVEGHIKDE